MSNIIKIIHFQIGKRRTKILLETKSEVFCKLILARDSAGRTLHISITRNLTWNVYKSHFTSEIGIQSERK